MPESPRVPEPPQKVPPQKVLDELVVSANSVIGLETENRISSETARIEDRVDAKVTRDVKVGGTIASLAVGPEWNFYIFAAVAVIAASATALIPDKAPRPD